MIFLILLSSLALMEFMTNSLTMRMLLSLLPSPERPRSLSNLLSGIPMSLDGPTRPEDVELLLHRESVEDVEWALNAEDEADAVELLSEADEADLRTAADEVDLLNVVPVADVVVEEAFSRAETTSPLVDTELQLQHVSTRTSPLIRTLLPDRPSEAPSSVVAGNSGNRISR